MMGWELDIASMCVGFCLGGIFILLLVTLSSKP